MLCAIWYHLQNLRKVKNTHGGVLLLGKLQAFHQGCFLHLLIFYKCYQIAQNVSYETTSNKFIRSNIFTDQVQAFFCLYAISQKMFRSRFTDFLSFLKVLFTYFFPMFPFEPPENIRITLVYDVSTGIKGNIGRKWINSFMTEVPIIQRQVHVLISI